MKKILILSLFTLFICCVENKESKVETTTLGSEVEKAAFFPKNYFKDTLYFNVSINHCGEWGGPEEVFVIYMDSIRNYYLNYKAFRFNCDSLDFYYGKKQTLEFEKTITLNDGSKVVVSNFLLDMMRAKIGEEYSDTGSSYSMFTNDSTFNLHIYSDQKGIEENYYRFKLSLGLPENRKKEIIIPMAD